MQFKEHDHELVQCLPLLFYSVGAEVIRLELMEPANIHKGTTLRKDDHMRIHLATMTHLQVCFRGVYHLGVNHHLRLRPEEH